MAIKNSIRTYSTSVFLAILLVFSEFLDIIVSFLGNLNLFKKVRWNIGGCQASLQSFNMNNHPLLSGNTGNTSCYAFKGAVCDPHKIVGQEMASFQINLHHMLVEQRRGFDERFHIHAANNQRRIIAILVS